jgi:(heptosyl)LPS beta-1,4-glucosyltransferase
MPVQRPTLSVVGISKNEEQDMPGFLRHLEPWVDEIVIVDDSSSDGTLDIVRRAGPKVKLVEHPMGPGGFAGQRNAGIQAARSDWLLHLDIDMRVTPDLAFEILQAISDQAQDAFNFRRKEFFLQHPIHYGGWGKWNNPWLARQGKHHFENRLHEQCVIESSPGRIGQLAHPAWHLNDRSYAERMGKNLLYAQFEAERIVASGRPVGLKELLFYPAWRAFKSFILYGGIREGMMGMIFATYVFYSTFNWYACAWDIQHRIDRADLEEAITSAWSQQQHESAKKL